MVFLTLLPVCPFEIQVCRRDGGVTEIHTCVWHRRPNVRFVLIREAAQTVGMSGSRYNRKHGDESQPGQRYHCPWPGALLSTQATDTLSWYYESRIPGRHTTCTAQRVGMRAPPGMGPMTSHPPAPLLALQQLWA